MIDVYVQKLKEARARFDRFAAATVVAVRGSSSAKPGAKAIISPEGRNFWGWVGGGCAESFLIEQSLEALAENRTRVVTVDLDDELLGVGMPCGGYMDVFIEPITAPRRLDLIGRHPAFAMTSVLASAADMTVCVHHPAAHARDYPMAAEVLTSAPEEVAPEPGAWWVLAEPTSPEILEAARTAGVAGILGPAAGLFPPGPAPRRPQTAAVALTARLIASIRGRDCASLSLDTGPDLPPSGARPELVIVGHGRIAEELARLGVLLGWRTIVNSPECEPDAFPEPAELITDDLSLEMRDSRPETHLVLAGQHKGDHAAARNALRSGLGWLCLIASRKRSDLIVTYLREEAGIPSERMGAFHGPAGLDIGAVTPFEIALSVIVQIIARNGDAA